MADKNVGLHLAAQSQVRVEKTEFPPAEKESGISPRFRGSPGLLAAIAQLLALLGL